MEIYDLKSVKFWRKSLRKITWKANNKRVYRFSNRHSLLLRRIIFSVFIVSSFLMSSMAQAGVRHIPIEEVFAKADFIIVGLVIDSKSRWDDRGLMIFTDYTIRVLENIKGNSPANTVMSFAGGRVGDKSIYVTETPHLQVGDKYIICGYDSEKKYAVPVVGNFQGIFRIVHDDVENMDYIVDYNGYQIEITDNQEIVKGAPVQKNADGSLSVRKELAIVKKEPPPSSIVRDKYGNIIPQEGRVFKKPKQRLKGVPATKREFMNIMTEIIRQKK